MKTFKLFAVLFFATSGLVNAQSPVATTYFEQTKIGVKTGLFMGYEFQGGYEAGVFYQKAMSTFSSSEGDNLPRFYEKEFVGVLVAAPLVSAHKVDVKLNARIGSVNKFSFVITPSVIAGYQVTKFMTINSGLGVRAFRPTFQTGLTFKL